MFLVSHDSRHLEMLQQHTQTLAMSQSWSPVDDVLQVFHNKVWPKRFRSRIHQLGNFWILEILHGTFWKNITGTSYHLAISMDTANESTVFESVFSLVWITAFGSHVFFKSKWPIKPGDQMGLKFRVKLRMKENQGSFLLLTQTIVTREIPQNYHKLCTVWFP